MVKIMLFLFWAFYMSPYAFTQDPVANLPQGRIIGIKVYVKNSLVPIEIYYGVPYAIPPIGRFRFSAPERHPGWKRTFFAHRLPPTCPQTSDGENNYFSEDCLFLNIWTPKSGDGSVLPVMVILYSESWLEGGVSLPCQDLAAEGVVVVTVNYRHHILGYFTLGSTSARGNLALLDQYLALVWVRENIAAFGGDPNMITLLGHSAGADSVLYHMGSNRAAGLYKRAIIISPRDVWKVLDKANNLNTTVTETVTASREIALALDCTDAVDEDILRCMRSRPLGDIVSLYLNSNWSRFMKPVPDIFLPESEQYLPTSLSAALSTSKQSIAHLDLILGTNDLESINYNEKTYEELIKRGESFISNFTDSNLIPKILRLLSLNYEESLLMQTQAIRWEYWQGTQRNSLEQTVGAIESYARIESSGKWGVGIGLLAARLARQVSRLYVYRYSQPGVNLLGLNLNFSGAVHGVDLVSLLGDTMMLQVARRPASLEERELSLIFRKHLIQFIKTGSPSGNEWQRYRPGDAQVYDFCNEKSYIRYSRDLTFWLQYLPHLTNMATCSYPEQFKYEKGDNNRLRSGVFAFSGLTAVLVLLLIACAFLLRKQYTRRLSITKL